MSSDTESDNSIREVQRDNTLERSATTLSINNLTKIYTGDERVKAVDDVSFEVENQEFVSIIGPSGSGKSTILRMIAGFEEPTDGEIVLDREIINERAPFNRATNMMFQDLALFPNMTVEENITYGLKQSGVNEEQQTQRAQEMLEMIQMSGYGDRAIHELSGGEQQRVALARCIINRPKLVLFDEPLASLDRKLRQSMTGELRRIKEETGLTFLYVTHDQEVALSVSDRVVILNDGKIEQTGPPRELYENPATEFVADFVGDMNLIELDANSTGQQSNSIDTNIYSTVPDSSGDGMVTVGIRPHSVDINNLKEDCSEYYVKGEINAEIFDKNNTNYAVETGIGTFTVNTNVSVSIGDEVYLSFSDNDVHLYRGETE